MPYFIFLLIFMLFACNQGNQAMRDEVAKVAELFCKGQQKQLEIAQKAAEYKEKGQLPGEEINAQIDEANQYINDYTNALQKLMEKYKGQEQTVYELLKKEQLNCK